MPTEGERRDFIHKHRQEIATVVDTATAKELDAGERLSRKQEEQVLKRFETKVFIWQNPNATPDAKTVLLEAAEPAAYSTVKPLIEQLQKDERCRKMVLVTDNISGKRFTEEQRSFSFEQIQTPDKPVMADIPTGIDVVLALIEPDNSPDKVLLYAGKSIYGNDTAKTYLFIDGFLGGPTRRLLSDAPASHMDSIDKVFVPNDLAKRLLEGVVPKLKDRTVITGSLLLESLKQTLPDEELREEKRRLLRDKLAISHDAVTVLYSGFPSTDYEVLAGQSTTGDAQKHELTLNQETFKKTLLAVSSAAEKNPERNYALVVRTHPRAHGEDNNLEVPQDLPQNFVVTWANGPEYNYNDIVNAVVDIVACQSTSTELFFAPYRGISAVIFDYAGVQERINERVFGAEGVAALKESGGSVFISSESALSEYLGHFQGRPEKEQVPNNPILHIVDTLLAEQQSPR